VDGGRVVFVETKPFRAPPNAKPEEIGRDPVPPRTRLIIFVDSLHSAPFNRNRSSGTWRTGCARP
jgi:hypothetical protein